MSPGVKVRGLCVDLGGTRIVDDVDFDAAGGGWTTVIGPNGAGKTTLLRAIAGLIPSESGSVQLAGEDLSAMSVRQRARMVAVMPQTPVIPPRMHVVDYILLGRTPHLGHGMHATREDLDVVRATMADIGLDSFAGRRLDQLSGGERQSVIIARAIAQQAKLLLLDEPTTSLDIGRQQEVLELVDRLRAQQGLTVVATIHDLGLAAQYSDHLHLLVDGRVVATGTPEEVLVPELLSEVYRADLEVIHRNGEIVVIPRRAGI